jgi:hypothetical protein
VREQVPGLMRSNDAIEGMTAMMQRREPVYRGE